MSDTWQMHYILTLQWRDKLSDHIHTWSGTVDVQPGMSRARLYNDIMSKIREVARIDSDPACLFFSLEPNRLGTP